MISLTPTENEYMLFLVRGGLPTDLHDDNCSWFSSGELIAHFKANPQAVGGVMASLSNKGLIADNGDGTEFDWYVTPQGAHYAQSVFG